MTVCVMLCDAADALNEETLGQFDTTCVPRIGEQVQIRNDRDRFVVKGEVVSVFHEYRVDHDGRSHRPIATVTLKVDK